MIETYKDSQSLFYQETIRIINNDKVSHAYLIETNDCSEKDAIILAFIKSLFCNNRKLNQKKCDGCNICHLIDNNAFNDFVVIEPSGMWIKKEQIYEVKEKLKTASLDNRPRIYLIKDAEKLNKPAGNALLKFLEEPEGTVIAILETSNRYRVLETLQSRCQTLSLINHDNKVIIDNYDEISDIINILEKEKEKAIVYFSIKLKAEYNTKDYWNDTFNKMLYIYEKALREKNGICSDGDVTLLSLIMNNNTNYMIVHKIKIICNAIVNLEYNVNITMMLDKFIIEFTGGGLNG